MDLTQNHADIAWDNFLAQFANSPKLESLVRALHAPNNGLQGALRQLYDERWLDTATGKQLDGIGEIVGQTRDIDTTVYVSFFGFSSQEGALGFGQARMRRRYEPAIAGTTRLQDSEYRKILYWKIAVNNSHGTAPEIIAATAPIFGARFARVRDAGNGKIWLWISTLPGPNNPLMTDPYRWIPTAAGVGVRALTGSTDTPFGFKHQGLFGFGTGSLARQINVTPIQ